jgi:CRISPR-associated protein Cmr1
MKILEYKIKFLTPAFLGDAQQNGRWRTPPFKALLRQWWRVVYAADHKFNVDIQKMRQEEGRLFGNAWLTHRAGGKEVADYSKSLVRLRLDRWDPGKETKKSWGNKDLDPRSKVKHPEVSQPIGPTLYLGYGPLLADKPQGGQPSGWATVLKGNTAIQAGEWAKLSLAIPDNDSSQIERAVRLMHLYGAAGGRSRNGWGSFVLEPAPALSNAAPKRNWRQALGSDWPEAIGAEDDGRPLVWSTQNNFENWLDLMRVLAIVKIGLRTQFVFPGVPPHTTVQPRHWLSYPITKHTTTQWGKTMRLPNSLRFKVRPAPEDPKKLIGVIFHMPCSPPSGFTPQAPAIEQTWKAVHALLDELTLDPGKRTYSSITDSNRRAQLQTPLNDVQLKRIKE